MSKPEHALSSFFEEYTPGLVINRKLDMPIKEFNNELNRKPLLKAVVASSISGFLEG